MPHHTGHGLRVLLAAAALAAVLGSVHAFSVFLTPLEGRFGASRSAISLTYSLALVALTCAVLIGPRYYARCSAARFVLITCALGAFGAGVAALAPTLPLVWLGYSLIFGAANGLGYGFGLQIAAQANPGREGLAMGIVTAAYALGSVVAPVLFALAVEASGFALAMQGLGFALVAVGLGSAALMRAGGTRFAAASVDGPAAPSLLSRIPLLWLGYFGGVMAGLMVLGHAAGILATLRPGVAAWVAPVVISACNLAGSLMGGQMADRIPLGRVLAGLTLATMLALTGLASGFGAGGFGASGVGAGVVIPLLGLVGFAYGGTIAAYPAAIAKLYGMRDSARIYGLVFTAWGAAGLMGPWLAGYLFDLSGRYDAALICAAMAASLSIASVGLLFRRRPA